MKTRKNTISGNSLQVLPRELKNTVMSVSLPLLAALLMIFLVPFNAMASRERFVLDFNDSHIRGHNGQPASLFLKKSLKQQYPHADISKMDLRKVVLVAKSNRGRGGAQLRVGNRVTATSVVDGNRRSFKNYRRPSFDTIGFQNPSNNSRGPWQVDLKGNFIVRKVVLEVEDHRRSPRSPHKGRWSRINH